MEEHTKKLLEECNTGCIMGLKSMEQISQYIKDEKLAKVLEDYQEKYKDIEKETLVSLAEYGERGKEPGPAASAFSWISTEMKLIVKDDSSQLAKLLMDGCNMGIKSISESMNDYADSSNTGISLAKKLVKTNEDFMKDLKEFL